MIKPPFNKTVVSLRKSARISWQHLHVCVCVCVQNQAFERFDLFISIPFYTHFIPLFFGFLNSLLQHIFIIFNRFF